MSKARIAFNCEQALKDRVSKHLEWGETRHVYIALTEQLADLLETYDPHLVKAAIISKQVKLSQLIDLGKTKKEED